MKIRVKFGLVDTREAYWWKDILDFPRLIKFCGKNFEWGFYDTTPNGDIDCELIFTELSTYDPNYNVDCPTWNDLFSDSSSGGCECGSKYDKDSPNGHMFYCKYWKPFEV